MPGRSIGVTIECMIGAKLSRGLLGGVQAVLCRVCEYVAVTSSQ